MRLLLLSLLALSACGEPADGPVKDTASEGDADTDTDTDADTDTDTDTDTDPASEDGDGDGALPSIDCDDDDPTVYPGAPDTCNGVDDDCDGETDEDETSTMYLDADGDGFGDPAAGLTGCEFPDSYIADATDCDDTDADVHPGAPEPDCTDPTDYDCDGDVAFTDEDGDGTAACEDCDDEDATAYPGATEDCDGDDDDCDGTADDGATTTFYGDADGDGAGGTRFTEDACDAPSGFVTSADDCDDLDADAFPGGVETCDGADDDCDGTVDEDATDADTFYVDDDGDGYGVAGTTATACELPAGYAATDDDCDDTEADVYPDAPERCDGTDHDCDGATMEADATDAPTWYGDADGDGFGSSTYTTAACAVPTGYVASSTDCDDGDDTTFPGATESCNSNDDDCDGSTDESGSTGETTWYRDADSDGYGSPTSTRSACTIPSGYADDALDCDDSRATVNPMGSESCNDLDDDCDGTTDESGATGGTDYYPDDDGDGFGDRTGTTVESCDAPVGYRLDGTDCDDADAHIHPYAYESTSDGTDNDCDGYTDGLDRDTRRTGPSGNDAGTSVNLTTTSFPFCGSDYTSFYMQSNGRLTFASNDTDSTETSVDLAGDVTVAGLWDDLRSSSSSTMEWTEHSDAVAFHWVDVPENSGSNTATFSIVLFDDGRILLDYGTLMMNDGLAGYSCGTGTAGGETDLSAAMDAISAGRWGIGNGTEDAYYEVFNTDNDLDDSVVRLCGNPDDGTDPCAE